MGRNFRGDKLSWSPRAKINFRRYKLSRMVHFRNFAGINFRDRMKFWWNSLHFWWFLIDISITPMKVKFCGYKLSRVQLNKRFRGYKLAQTPKKIAESRKFIPAKVHTFRVVKRTCSLCNPPPYEFTVNKTRQTTLMASIHSIIVFKIAYKK